MNRHQTLRRDPAPSSADALRAFAQLQAHGQDVRPILRGAGDAIDAARRALVGAWKRLERRLARGGNHAA